MQGSRGSLGILPTFPHGSLGFRTHEPDYSNLSHMDYDWQRTACLGVKEEVPHDIPEPKWKHVTTSTYVDANLHHDQVTGKVVTACLYLAMPLLLIGIPKGNLQLKLQLLGLNSWQPGLPQTRSLTSGTLSYILEFQSDPKATSSVTTNLWLTVQVSPPLPCPRNQLWHPIIESEKPLLLDIFYSTGKMENPTLQTS